MNYINFIINFIILLFLIACSSTVAANPNIASQLSQLLSGFNTYQAVFKQITLDSEDRVIRKSQGRVIIMSPGRFRWETDSPTKQIIIMNGKKLCVYNVDLAQEVIYPIMGKTNINPASLLSGSINDLNQKFSIAIALLNDGNGVVFHLLPKRGQGLNFNSLCLKFVKNQLVEMIVFNNLNEKSIFQFNRIKMNVPLSIQLFKFQPSCALMLSNNKS